MAGDTLTWLPFWGGFATDASVHVWYGVRQESSGWVVYMRTLGVCPTVEMPALEPPQFVELARNVPDADAAKRVAEDHHAARVRRAAWAVYMETNDPPANDPPDVVIPEHDLRVHVFTTSGVFDLANPDTWPGVRVVHIPTGITAVHSDPSWGKAKRAAVDEIRYRLQWRVG